MAIIDDDLLARLQALLPPGWKCYDAYWQSHAMAVLYLQFAGTIVLRAAYYTKGTDTVSFPPDLRAYRARVMRQTTLF